MKIGIAGPMNLNLLNFEFNNKDKVPAGYDFPMISFLINAFIERSYKVIAYTTSTEISYPIVYESPNLTICIVRRRNKHSARDLFKQERKDLMKVMHYYPCDIINAQWSYEFAWAAINSRIPTIVTLQDHAMTIFRYQTDPYRFMRLIMNYIVLNKASYLSVNSEYLFNKLDNRKKRKTKVIPNFYSKLIEDMYDNQEKKSEYILSVSNGFGKRKNIDTALKAFTFVRKQFPNIEYHLVGDDMEPFGLAYQFSLKNNMLNGVKFLGKLPFNEVIQKTQKAKIFLHPSREESFGMAVLEAMIIGTPVVGGEKSGNIPNLLDHGNAGELCDINSPEDMGRSIIKVLQNKQYADKLMRDAHIYAEKNYSEKLIISKYLDCYYDIIVNKATKANKCLS